MTAKRVFSAKHDGRHLGGCSVIIAQDEAEARALLSDQLNQLKLDDEDIEIEELLLTESKVHVLFDGDY